MQILDGKQVAAALKTDLKQKVEARKTAGLKTPHLVAILVGTNGASETYVASKIKNCAAIGFKSTLIRLEAETTQEALQEQIKKLNADDDVDGILVQLPLPKHIDEGAVIVMIDPLKDVDGFHPENVGKLVLGMPGFVSATPMGIMQILDFYKIPTAGKHAVVIGRSNIVGRPMSILLSRNSNPGNCTVTLCHSKTENLDDICRTADIIVAALGIPKFLKAGMIKEGAVIIDVGITRIIDSSTKAGYRLEGDADYENLMHKCSAITPVPGGVGVMTITALLMNTFTACSNKD